MNHDPSQMNPYSLHFADAALERAFREERAAKMLKPLRAARLILAGSMLLLWAFLPQVLPAVPDARSRYATRMSIAVAVFVVGYGRTYFVASYILATRVCWWGRT